MKKKYFVWSEDTSGREFVDGIFEDLQEAKEFFGLHKADKDHYCRLEEIEIEGYDAENECDILGDNDTIESYYPEDEEE